MIILVKNKKLNNFYILLIILFLFIISIYLWIHISHIFVDYSACESKQCLTKADIFGNGIVFFLKPIFIVLLLIKLGLVVYEKLKNNYFN